MSVDCEGAGKS